MATIDGTAGNDILGGTSGDDILNGLAGNDSLEGAGGADSLFGGPGTDSLLGGEGNDTLDGGAGNDSLNGGAGDDVLIGRRGVNVYDDFSGFDTVDLQFGSTAIALNVNGTIFHDGGEVDTLASGIERVSGTFFADVFAGSASNDQFAGITGNDSFTGGDGNDVIDGGTGDDLIQGEGGSDTLMGGAGSDSLTGGTGNNLIDGGDGEDTLSYVASSTGIVFHGDGTITHDANANDTIAGIERIVGSSFDDLFDGGSGDDHFDGGEGDDTVIGGLGNDTLEGGGGSDLLDAGIGGRALFTGGAGNDTLTAGQTLVATASWQTSPAGIMLLAGQGTAEDGFGTTDTLINIHRFVGSPHNDTMTAGQGLDGVVDFFGGGGDDVFGSGGFDILDTGLVRLHYDLEPAGGTINMETGTAQFPGHDDTLIEIHDLVGTPFNDTISGSFDDDNIEGGAGNDEITDIAGNDSISAGDGDDTVMLGFGLGVSTVDGGDGTDTFGLLLLSAPPPQGVGAPSMTRWEATGAATLMVTQTFDDLANAPPGPGTPVYGIALPGMISVGKSEGTQRLLLDPLEQSFDAALYALDLVLVANGNLGGTLGSGDDTVIAGAGIYSLDGGAGENMIDYSGVGAGIAAAIDGDQASVQSGADTQMLQHFRSYAGSSFADSFTSTPFDAVAPFAVADILAIVESGLPTDLPTVDGGSGSDSYRGRLAVDYRSAGGAVTIAPSFQPGVRQASIPGGTDTLQDVLGVLLPADGNTVDYGSDRNVFLEVSGGSNAIAASSGSLLSYAGLASDLDIDLAQGRVAHGSGTDTVAGIARVVSGSGDDTVAGDGQDNIIAPAGGSNVVDGGGGADTVVFGFARSAVAGHVYFRDSQRLLFLAMDDGSAAAQSLSHVETGSFAGESVPVTDFARALPSFDATTQLGGGQSTLIAPTRNDDIAGSAGANIILDQGGANRIDGQGGGDLVLMTGLGGMVPPGTSDDEILGGDGNDTVFAGSGADIVDGGAGEDLLLGEDGADSLGGGGESDLLFGGAGNDLLAGEDGNDSIFGEAGQDVLVGGAGDDRLHADGDDLAVVGAGGKDVLAILGSTTGLSVIDLSADNQNQSGAGPVVGGIEGVDATLANAAVSLRGGVFDGAGSLLAGSAFDDTLTGGDGADTLVGGPGGDLIAGGLGNDSIVLDAGNDSASGGGGGDDFAYAGGPGSSAVQISDFVPGQDRMVLSDTLTADGVAALGMLGMSGVGALIDFGDGRTITFVGVAAMSFTALDFLIV